MATSLTSTPSSRTADTSASSTVRARPSSAARAAWPVWSWGGARDTSPPQYDASSSRRSWISRTRTRRGSILRNEASRCWTKASASSGVKSLGIKGRGVPASMGSVIASPTTYRGRGIYAFSADPVGGLDRAGRVDEDPQLPLRLVDGPRLEPAVRVDRELLRAEHLEGPFDPLHHHPLLLHHPPF